MHQNFDFLLKKYVSKNGTVNYKDFLKDKSKFKVYLNLLSKINVSNLPLNQQMAFWINAYNASTIDLILSNYPLKSIKNIYGGKVWDMPLQYQFEGKTTTLNDIENKKLLQNFNDARIHFAINCAAKSCPKLSNKAFTALNLEKTLTANTQDFINNTNQNKFSDSKVLLSQIFNWFKPDFVKAEGSVNAFVNKYSNQKILQKHKIDFLEYNWDLNGN